MGELVLCGGTLGAADVPQLIDAARAGGFAGLTLWPDHVARSRAAGARDAELAARIADAGLTVEALDPLLSWLPGEPVPEGFADERVFFELAETFGARSINVAQGFGNTIDPGVAAEALAGLGERAEERGLAITLEYLPWSGIPDAASALALVERAGCANAGVMVDAWHTWRGPTDAAQLRALPGPRVGGIQLNDAPAEPAPDPIAETLHARRLPGQGDAPLAEWLGILQRAAPAVPVGVEVFSDALAALPVDEVGRRCGAAARAVLAPLEA